MRFLSKGTGNLRPAEENHHVPRFVVRAYIAYLTKGLHTGHKSGYVGHVRYQMDAMQHNDVSSHGAAVLAVAARSDQSQYLPERNKKSVTA